MVFSHADTLCYVIINAWARWLTDLSQTGKKYELTDSDKNHLRLFGYTPIEEEKLISTLESYIGKPIGSRLQYLSRYDTIIEILDIYLCAYLVTHILEASDPAWDALNKDMEQPVIALSGLVDTYGVVMDPKLVEDVMGLSVLLYSLRRGDFRGMRPTTIKRDVGTIPITLSPIKSQSYRLAASAVIAQAIVQTVKLKFWLCRKIDELP